MKIQNSGVIPTRAVLQAQGGIRRVGSLLV